MARAVHPADVGMRHRREEAWEMLAVLFGVRLLRGQEQKCRYPPLPDAGHASLTGSSNPHIAAPRASRARSDEAGPLWAGPRQVARRAARAVRRCSPSRSSDSNAARLPQVIVRARAMLDPAPRPELGRRHRAARGSRCARSRRGRAPATRSGARPASRTATAPPHEWPIATKRSKSSAPATSNASSTSDVRLYRSGGRAGEAPNPGPSTEATW